MVSSISQVILKKSANKSHENLKKEYLNIRVVGAYGLFFLATLITITAYRGLPLSLGLALESTGYVFVSILSYLFLKEKMNKIQILGIFLIVGGVIIFAY